MSLRFGTDGVRGVANTELTPELVLALGRAAARVIGGDRFLVGRDTRRSGPLLQSALSAGLASEGVDVVDLGVLTTPGVAFLSTTDAVPAAMISASHNAFADNGIKFFGPGGRKLNDDVETELEAALDELWHVADRPAPTATGEAVGLLSPAAPNAAARYIDHLVAAVGANALDGSHVVLDCANGAASPFAAAVFSAAGAKVDVIADEPNGVNINAGCGSTHPEALAREVVRRGALAGLAFDGDADRVVAVDERGDVVDGDQVIALCALDLRAQGRLAGDTVVVTVMSNLGLRRAMDDAGVRVRETQVGDRYVLEALEAGGWSLGGEQSGHVIFRDLATTGDGMLTGLVLLDVLRRSGRAMSELAGSVMRRYPQVLRNVRVRDRESLEGAQAVWDAVTAEEAALGADGRVLLRASGTEPLVRVMVEAPTAEAAEAAAARLCAVVESALS